MSKSKQANPGLEKLIKMESLFVKKLDFSRPGKPTDNAYIESFNARFRLECLNEHWFMSLEDAREKTEKWRLDYNQSRLHNSLGNVTPEEFAASGANPKPLPETVLETNNDGSQNIFLT